jgi:hypothetical protein
MTGELTIRFCDQAGVRDCETWSLMRARFAARCGRGKLVRPHFPLDQLLNPDFWLA